MSGVPEQGLREALELAAVRLEILTARMRGCNEETGKHELLDEAEMFCAEARAALERPRPVLSAPQDCPKCGGLDGTHVRRNCPGAALPPQTGNPPPDLREALCELVNRWKRTALARDAEVSVRGIPTVKEVEYTKKGGANGLYEAAIDLEVLLRGNL